MELFRELNEYKKKDIYPFHMPGHKRNSKYREWKLPFDRDITEITGFDNLHHATGILRESQERLSGLYGTRKSFYSVNGSTGAVLAAVSAALPAKGVLLMGRNCHRSVYHAACLRNLRTIYLYPGEDNERSGRPDMSVRPEQVKRAFEKEPEIGAVVITSPAYDGVVSDIASIARVCHEHKAVLIVDEAHGAHLRFSDCFPSSAVDLGADLVIHSLHKTLPAMTQTAALHVCTDLVDPDLVRHYLEVYMTSSPSYILMESLDRCVKYLEQDGEKEFVRYTGLLKDFRNRLSGLQSLRLWRGEGCYDYDISKLVICTDQSGLSGFALSQILLEKYGIALEMESAGEILALTSVGDTEEGFARLGRALQETDPAGKRESASGKRPGYSSGIYPPNRPGQCMTMYSASEAELERVPLVESAGRISGEFVYLYPPGAPLVVPGEYIDGELVRDISMYREEGRSLGGMRDLSEENIWVLKD